MKLTNKLGRYEIFQFVMSGTLGQSPVEMRGLIGALDAERATAKVSEYVKAEMPSIVNIQVKTAPAYIIV